VTGSIQLGAMRTSSLWRWPPSRTLSRRTQTAPICIPCGPGLR
jgi:hypothetical protein